MRGQHTMVITTVCVLAAGRAVFGGDEQSHAPALTDKAASAIVSALPYRSLIFDGVETRLGMTRTNVVTLLESAKLSVTPGGSNTLFVWRPSASDYWKQVGEIDFNNGIAVTISHRVAEFAEDDKGTAFGQRLCSLLDWHVLEHGEKVIVRKAKATVQGELQTYVVEFAVIGANMTLSYSSSIGKLDVKGKSEPVTPSISIDETISLEMN